MAPNFLSFKGKSTKEIVSTRGWTTYSTNIKNVPAKLLVLPAGFEGRPDLLSYEVYGTTDYWWVICLANDIIDPFEQFKAGKQIKVPVFDNI